jgi:hypothetical protein
MDGFDNESLSYRSTLHPNLAGALDDVRTWFAFTIRQGHRPDDEQDALFTKGLSKARAGQSTHNKLPSHGVDVLPSPITAKEWAEFEAKGRDSRLFARCAMLAGAIIQSARGWGLEVRWGGDWNQDERDLGGGFNDGLHLEIVGIIEEMIG